MIFVHSNFAHSFFLWVLKNVIIIVLKTAKLKTDVYGIWDVVNN